MVKLCHTWVSDMRLKFTVLKFIVLGVCIYVLIRRLETSSSINCLWHSGQKIKSILNRRVLYWEYSRSVGTGSPCLLLVLFFTSFTNPKQITVQTGSSRVMLYWYKWNEKLNTWNALCLIIPLSNTDEVTVCGFKLLIPLL